MQFTVETTILQSAIKRVLPASAKKPHMPALLGILFRVTTPPDSNEGTLTLRATDLELAIETSIPVKKAVAGEAVLDAAMIAKIVQSAQSGETTITPDPAAPHRYTVTCGRARFDISSIVGADEFPLSAQAQPTEAVGNITIAAGLLELMIDQTVYAAAKEDSRRFLCGVNVTFGGESLRLTATNAYRLATIAATPVPTLGSSGGSDEVQSFPPEIEGSGSAIIPATAMKVFGKALCQTGSCGRAKLSITPREARLHIGFDTYTVRIIDGTYPDWRRIMPTTFPTAAKVLTDDARAAIKQATVMALDSGGTKMTCEDSRVVLTSKSAGVGAVEAIVPAEVTGEPLALVFKHEYLSDILKRTSDDNTEIRLAGKVKPIVVEYEPRVEAVWGVRTSVTTLIMPFNNDLD
jgi:DNA polymerase-3 subunit beta